MKLLVAREIQYFELGIFSFNSCVYYHARHFIASTRAFNLLTRAFNLPTRAFSPQTRAFNLATRAFSVLTRGFELVIRGFELVTRGFELVTRGFELVTRNSCFTFPRYMLAYILGITKLGIKRIRKLRQILESTNRSKRVTNIGSLRDFKLGQKKYKSGKVFQTGPKRFQIGAEITNQGNRNYKPGQGFKIGVGITNRCRTTFPLRYFKIGFFFIIPPK